MPNFASIPSSGCKNDKLKEEHAYFFRTRVTNIQVQ
jgi:hypothetical protein